MEGMFLDLLVTGFTYVVAPVVKLWWIVGWWLKRHEPPEVFRIED